MMHQMIKKYISTGAIPLSIDIVHQGELLTFDFRGGKKHPVVIFPTFSTSSEKEQSLLENHPSFKKSFKLLEIREEVNATKEEVKKIQPEVVTFKNVQDAKDWLNKEHSISYTQLLNKEKVISAAQSVGAIIEFESEKK